MSDSPSVPTPLCSHRVLNCTLDRVFDKTGKQAIYYVTCCADCHSVVESRRVGRGGSDIAQRKPA